MSELLPVISAVATLALPFILMYLNNIGADLRALRESMGRLVTEQAVQRSELNVIKKQLNLMDEQSA